MLAGRVLSRARSTSLAPRAHRALLAVVPELFRHQRSAVVGLGATPAQRRRCASVSCASGGEPCEELLSELRALPEDMRQSLAHAMIEGDLGEAKEGEEIPLTRSQTQKLFIATAIPMVGFGFMDNAVMIIAGEFIEIKLGAAMCISTLAAAGFGNTISDLVGLGAGGLIESAASKLGIDAPPMTAAQLAGRSATMTKHAGSAIGLTIGCIVGMFPLLFHDEEDMRLRTIFVRYDKDGNGALDWNEIGLAFNDAKMYPSERDMHHLFDKYDKDKDGTIAYEEFKVMAEDLEQRLKHDSILDARGLMAAEAMYLEMDH